MKVKWTFLAVAAVFLALVLSPAFGAVDTSEIDKVRTKGVLDEEDLQIIDSFVSESVDELANTRDFTIISKVRASILARAKSSTESAASQYMSQFSESANKYIARGLEEAEQITQQDRKFKVILNLLMLVDELADLHLADLAIKRLNDSNAAIRYWAVHSLTNRGIVKQLNQANPEENAELAKKIVERLKGVVEILSPEELALVAGFAAELNIPQGGELLLQVADVRIKRYAGWTVRGELLDGTILGLVYSRMTSTDAGKAAFGRRFGQLYSYIMQKYIKDLQGGNFLGADQRQQMASVLVEVEKSCVSEVVGVPQSTIKRAVEMGDYTALLGEHNRLLGDETRPGQLAVKLDFDYGKNTDGSKRTAPLVLSEPPKTKSSE